MVIRGWCILSPSEVEAKGRELAQTVAQRAARDEHRKTVAKELAAEVADLDKQIASLARLVREGREEREVEVRDVTDDAAGVVHTVREDTGEVVATRPIHPRPIVPAPIREGGSP